jgi:ribosome-associated toxin RatA of RatAB toxin-antitoxin module
VSTARAEATVALTPEAAFRLWTDVDRWPTFVEGFQHVLELSSDWPAEAARVVWRSGPGGRGQVTEKVLASGPGRFATQVYETALVGEQAVSFGEAAEGCRVELRLDYRLTSYGPLRRIADFVFIRRAIRDALRRTLRRFAAEAEDEAGLR